MNELNYGEMNIENKLFHLKTKNRRLRNKNIGKKLKWFVPIKENVLYISDDGRKAVRLSNFGGYLSLNYFVYTKGKRPLYRVKRTNRFLAKSQALKYLNDKVKLKDL